MKNIKEKPVNWHPKTQKLYQIPKEGMEFAFVSEDFQQIHQLVWCKDFLQDAIWGHLNQKKVSIYGFTYDPETMPPLFMDKTRLLITNWKDQNFNHKLLNNCLPFLNAFEKKLKMQRTIVFKCQKTPTRYGKSGVWMLEGSKRWMKSPPMISLYTLLIRAGMIHEIGVCPLTTLQKIADKKIDPYFGGDKHDGAKDGRNVTSILPKLRQLLKIGDRKIFHRNIHQNFPAKCLTTKLHNNYGFVGFSAGSTKTDFPHWHRKEIR